MNQTVMPMTISNYTEYRTKADWIIPMTISSFLVVATLWILISLIYYGIKTNKWKTMNSSNYDKLNAGLIYTAVVVCTTLCLIRLIISLFYMDIGFTVVEKQNRRCNSLFDAMGVMYGMVIMSTYTFLWLRQRVFYANRMLNVKYTRISRMLSAVSIFVIVTCGVCVLIFSTIPNDHFSGSNGCFYKPDRRLFIGYYVSIVLLVFVGNAVLFGLFAYGLYKANETPSLSFASGDRRKSNNSKTEATHFHSENNNNNNNKGKNVIVTNLSIQLSQRTLVPTSNLVKRVVKKTLFFAVISVVCDVILQILLYFTSIQRRVITTSFNVNAFLNVLLMIASFVQYKKMLFSPCYSKAK